MRVEAELLKARVGVGVKGRQCGWGRSYIGPMRPVDIKVSGVRQQKKKRDRKKKNRYGRKATKTSFV